MEMKQTRTGKHQIFFPHGFIDPLTGAKLTRFYVDGRHFDLLKAAAEEQGVSIRRYMEGLLKEGKSPFAEEASKYAQTAGKKETAKVSLGIPYFIRLAEKSDFRTTWSPQCFNEWAEDFVWRDTSVLEALKNSFKGEQSKVEIDNPAFHEGNGRISFAEFIEILSYRFFVKNCTELNLFFTLKDCVAMLSKIEFAD